MLLFVMMSSPAAAGDVVLTTPVYLNGLPEYTLTGSSGLGNVACDAVLAAAKADVAVLNGGLFSSSLPAGQVTYAELEAALRQDADLITTELTGAEITGMLNDLLVCGSENFPQVGGIRVLAERSLTESGSFCGTVTDLEVGGAASGSNQLYSVVTTRELAEACHLPRQTQPLGQTLLEAIVSYGAEASGPQIEAAADAQRLCIVSDTIDLAQAASQLMLRVPSPVVLGLNRPDMIPDALIYALQGQDRWLCAWFPLQEIPYALCIDGAAVTEPVSVPTDVAITQDVPRGRKTANTLSEKTVFVDLRDSGNIPEGSEVFLDLSGIYPDGMLLFLYYYDDNGDIVPLEPGTATAENGIISLPAASGLTYIINDRQLNQAALQAPAPQHPWTAGVVCVYIAFTLWIVWAWRRRQRTQ